MKRVTAPPAPTAQARASLRSAKENAAKATTVAGLRPEITRLAEALEVVLDRLDRIDG